MANNLSVHEDLSERDSFILDCIATFLSNREETPNSRCPHPAQDCFERFDEMEAKFYDIRKYNWPQWARKGRELVITREYAKRIPVDEFPPRTTSERMSKIGSDIVAVARLEDSDNYVKLYEKIGDQLFNELKASNPYFFRTFVRGMYWKLKE